MSVYTEDQRKKALDCLIRNDLAITAAIVELGYPTRQTLYQRYREPQNPIAPDQAKEKWPHYTRRQKQVAVDHYLDHGRNLAKTTKGLGCPSISGLKKWMDDIVPGKRECQRKQLTYSENQRIDAVPDLAQKTAHEIAGEIGSSTASVYDWRGQSPGKEARRAMAGTSGGQSPGGIGPLKRTTGPLEAGIRRPRMEAAVWRGAAESVKKAPASIREISPTRRRRFRLMP